MLRGYPTVRWRAWLEIPEVKTRPVLNCRLENLVVDKSRFHQQSGRDCNDLTSTVITSGLLVIQAQLKTYSEGSQCQQKKWPERERDRTRRGARTLNPVLQPRVVM